MAAWSGGSGESIIKQVDAYEELHEALRDAVRCHFEEKDLTSLIRPHFVRDEVIAARNRQEISLELKSPTRSAVSAIR